LDLGRRPLGDVVQVRGALSDGAALTPGGAPVDVRLEIHGDDPRNQITRTLRRSNASGVAELSIDLPVPGDTGTVVAVISTSRDARRHFGVELRIVERAPPAGARPSSPSGHQAPESP
jgi:hypothetical protein